MTCKQCNRQISGLTNHSPIEGGLKTCTAPSRDAVIDRLTDELATAKDDLLTAENNPVCPECGGAWGDHSAPACEYCDGSGMAKSILVKYRAVAAELAQGHAAYQRLCDSLETAGNELAALKAERQADTERLYVALQQMNVFFGSMAGACEDEAEVAIDQCRKALAMHAAIDAARQAKP